MPCLLSRVSFCLLLLIGSGCSPSGTSTPSPTPVARAASYLEQAEKHYKAKKYQEASAAALLAVEDTKAKGDAPGSLQARTLLACSESKLGSPSLGELGKLAREKLDPNSRARVQGELAKTRASALSQLKAARASFAKKKYSAALEQAGQGLNQLNKMGNRQHDGATLYLISRCYSGLGDSGKAQENLELAAKAIPPSQEARALTRRSSAARAPQPPPSSFSRDAQGNSILGSDGGLTMCISTEGYVGLLFEGQINGEIYLRREDWQGFKKSYQAHLTTLADYQRRKDLGGTSATVASTETVDLVICVGGMLGSHGWRVAMSQPVLEIWLCGNGSGRTPWRSRPGQEAMSEMIRRVDSYLAQLPTGPR